MQSNKKNGNKKSTSLLKSGVKYLAISLPLLFISPILITIGFKAIKKNDNYFMLVIGCVFAIFTILLVVQAFRKILNSLFDR